MEVEADGQYGAGMSERLSVNDRIDWDEVSQRFAATQRVQIPSFLGEAAADALRGTLLCRSDWRHVISAGAKVFEIARGDLDQMPTEAKAELERALHAEATHGFRFRYDLIRTPDDLPPVADSEDPLIGFARLMNDPGTIDRFRTLAPGLDLDFADAQATRYNKGDFLTRHDDDVAGKGRQLAYVLSLTPDWLPEWGGLLLFNGADGGIVETFVPSFNTLNLFAVPQPHSVSYVAPYAGAARISVTGWLRKAP
jgi:SM-20-related protein